MRATTVTDKKKITLCHSHTSDPKPLYQDIAHLALATLMPSATMSCLIFSAQHTGPVFQAYHIHFCLKDFKLSTYTVCNVLPPDTHMPFSLISFSSLLKYQLFRENIHSLYQKIALALDSLILLPFTSQVISTGLSGIWVSLQQDQEEPLWFTILSTTLSTVPRVCKLLSY